MALNALHATASNVTILNIISHNTFKLPRVQEIAGAGNPFFAATLP